MVITRPEHLQNRPIVGRFFSEPVQIITTTGTRNQYGEWTATEAAPVATVCATAPLSAGDARARDPIAEGGIRLSDMRLFWTAESIDPVTDASGETILVYAGERWRVSETQRWRGFSETLATRIETQATDAVG